MESIKQIAGALLKAQLEMSNPVKGATNPFFKSKYADLNAVREAVLPVLNKHGISVLQPMAHIDDRNFVRTVLLHESGEMLESFTEIVYKQNDAQAQGSGITYARRYGLQSMVCVGADDDDGNAASTPAKQPTAQQKQATDFNKLDEAVKEMKAAKNRDESDACWLKYKELHRETRFINAAKEAGQKYPKA